MARVLARPIQLFSHSKQKHKKEPHISPCEALFVRLLYGHPTQLTSKSIHTLLDVHAFFTHRLLNGHEDISIGQTLPLR